MDNLMSNEDLQKLHDIEVEILDEFVRICEKYQLTYFLSGGTLLGAVRHKGFIPWDDDLDVGMPRKDYDKFLDICEQELNEKYILDNKDTNPKYYLNFSKIRKKDTIFEQDFQVNYDGPKGIWLDIFAYDNAKSIKSKKIWLQSKLNRLLFSAIHYKSGFFLSQKFIIIKKFIGIVMKPIKHTTILNFQDKILKWNKEKEDYKYFVSLSNTYNYKTELIEKSKYLPVKKMEFEGKLYNAPNDSDFVLKNIYGDYMKLPPEEKRVTHNPNKLFLGDESKSGSI